MGTGVCRPCGNGEHDICDYAEAVRDYTFGRISHDHLLLSWCECDTCRYHGAATGAPSVEEARPAYTRDG